MPTDLITGDAIWPLITKHTKKHASKSRVAVAFFGAGAAKQLPLKAGSVLVVNAAEDTIKKGLTNPFELQKLLTKGVAIHSVNNLHGKVFAFPKTAVVGSANVSTVSANYLLEAVVSTSNLVVVKQCHDFVNSIAGDRLTKKQLRYLQSIYKPPKIPKLRRKTAGGAVRSRLWLRPSVYEEYDAKQLAALRRGKPKALKKLRSKSLFRLEDATARAAFARRLNIGDSIIILAGPRDANVDIHPQGRFIQVERIDIKQGILFMEVSKQLQPKSLAKNRKRFTRAEYDWLRKLVREVILKDGPLKQKLLQLWPLAQI